MERLHPRIQKIANRDSPAQFENRIKPLMYARCITRSTVYEKSSILLSGTGVGNISSVACGFSPIQIHFSDYLKSFINRINQVMIFQKNIAIAIFY